MTTKFFQITLKGELDGFALTAEELRRRLLNAFPFAHGSEIEVTEGTLGCVEVTDEQIAALRDQAEQAGQWDVVRACKRALTSTAELMRWTDGDRARIEGLRQEARIQVAQIIVTGRPLCLHLADSDEPCENLEPDPCTLCGRYYVEE